MNRKVLSKILTELTSEAPKLDYVRGMVEVLLALEPENNVDPIIRVAGESVVSMTNPTIVESAMTEAERTIEALRGGMNGAMTISASETIEHNTVQ